MKTLTLKQGTIVISHRAYQSGQSLHYIGHLQRLAVLVTVCCVCLPAMALAQAPAAGFPAAVAKPPRPVPVQQAVERMVAELLSVPSLNGRPITLVIDPLMDGVTGIQTVATRGLDARVAELIAKLAPNVTVLPFTRDNVAKATHVFIGTFNPINNAGQPTGERDAYWICFSVIEKASRTVVARAVGRTETTDVDATPAPLYMDSPVWALDAATLAYIRACQRSKPGDTVDAVYMDRLELRATLREANSALDRAQLPEARAAFQLASSLPGGTESVSALNGLYLTLMRDNRRTEALAVFQQLVALGLRREKLGVLLVFEPGRSQFVQDQAVSGEYAEWLQRLRSALVETDRCLAVVGHASRTGREPLNVVLSRRRAQLVRNIVVGGAKGLRARISTRGVGSREVLVGLPNDGPATAVDRRVEFRVEPCRGAKRS